MTTHLQVHNRARLRCGMGLPGGGSGDSWIAARDMEGRPRDRDDRVDCPGCLAQMPPPDLEPATVEAWLGA